MWCAFKPFPLEINSNGGLKRGYVESCTQSLKISYIYLIITTMPMATKLGRVVAYHEELPPVKSHDFLITWSCEIT